MANESRIVFGRRPAFGVMAGILCLASVVTMSAHVVRGLDNPTLATAFVSSPTSAVDQPVAIAWGAVGTPRRLDTGLRAACFYVANTSPARPDSDAWPRVTAVGFELPDRRSGFTLLEPLSEGWQIIEDVAVPTPQGETLTLDFAIVAPVNPEGHSVDGNPHDLPGIGPGQTATRGSGTRFCVAGPFPDGLSIEQIINGVVVRFHGVERHRPSVDIGVWDNPARTIPLYP